ncbi:sugar ABC transporter ATP-binding protein, partial [Burkholderia pseudomallei]
RAPAHPDAELSSGNQQKVPFGRWPGRDMGDLLISQPFRGIDFGAKFDIYAILDALERECRAIHVESRHMRDLIHICDRNGVMSAGRMH